VGYWKSRNCSLRTRPTSGCRRLSTSKRTGDRFPRELWKQSEPPWSEPESNSSTKTEAGKAFGFESHGIPSENSLTAFSFAGGLPRPSASPGSSVKRVLNAGSGPQTARQTHPLFRKELWQEVRLDIDPQAKPDVVGSITDMGPLLAQSFDEIWSSHSLEHLYAHEVPLALLEFKRVLKPDGFALIASPDLEAVAAMVLEHGLNHVAYTSPLGPITPLDLQGPISACGFAFMES